MSDKELCELFDTTLEDVKREVAAVEAGDFSAFDFDHAMLGWPMEDEKMDTVSFKVPHSRVVAVDRAAKEQGMTRFEFMRRAIGRELFVTA